MTPRKNLGQIAYTERLSIIRFPMILLILYIHSFVAPIRLSDQSIAVEPALWLQALVIFWSDGIARIAVPIFYLISGYLYFKSFDGSFAQYLDKSKRRITTLLIPYLLWNGLTFTLFLVGQSLPETAIFFNSENGRLSDQGIWRLFDIWLGINQYPIAYPFWFIRDLMLMVAIAPLFHWVLRQAPGVLEVVLLVAWLSTLIELPLPSIEGLTFFVLGASCGLSRRSLFIGDGHLRWILPVLLFSELINVWLRLDFRIYWLNRPVILIGVVALLSLTALIVERRQQKAKLTELAGMSFFIFASHEPLMTMLRKISYRVLDANQLTILVIYAVLPLFVAGISLLAYYLLRRILPSVASVLNGGRG